MDDIRKEARALREKLDKNERIVDDLSRQLGNDIAELDESAVKATPLEKLHQRSQDLSAFCVEGREMIEKIRRLETQVEKVDADLKKSKVQLKTFRGAAKAHYSQIGMAAREALDTNGESTAQYDQLISKARTRETELSRVEDQLRQTSESVEPQSFLKQVYQRSRRAYLRGLLLIKQHRQNTVHSHMGKMAFDSDLITQMSQTSTGMNLAPAFESRQAINRLIEEQDKLHARKRQLTNEILSVCDGARSSRPADEIKVGLAEAERQLLEVHLDLGRTFISKSLGDLMSSEGIELAASRIDSLVRENQRIESQIRKLEATIAIERIEAKIAEESGLIERLKDTIGRKESEIESSVSRISDLNLQKEEQIAIRDSEADRDREEE